MKLKGAGRVNQKLTSKIYTFLIFTIKNYIKNDCTHRASSLTITTLLTMVPLLTVFFTLLALLPYFDQVREPLQNFIFSHLVPDSSQKIQSYIIDFTAKASKFSLSSGIAILLYSMLLIYNIELALNKIWRVGNTRKPLNGFLVYLAILFVLPVFLGCSLLLSTYLREVSIFGAQYAIEKNLLMAYAPFLLAWVSFSFLYYVVPNTRVKFSQAQISALLATVLFEVVKLGFSLYLSYVTLYEMMYGVFAILPFFIIWIDLVWLITLFCAEINHSLATFNSKA